MIMIITILMMIMIIIFIDNIYQHVINFKVAKIKHEKNPKNKTIAEF